MKRTLEGEGARLRFAVPKGLGRYIVEKGFITVDGVSLTVAAGVAGGGVGGDPGQPEVVHGRLPSLVSKWRCV